MIRYITLYYVTLLTYFTCIVNKSFWLNLSRKKCNVSLIVIIDIIIAEWSKLISILNQFNQNKHSYINIVMYRLYINICNLQVVRVIVKVVVRQASVMQTNVWTDMPWTVVMFAKLNNVICDVSSDITLHQLILSSLTWSDLTSPHLVSLNFTSPHITLHNLTQRAT